MTIEEKIAHIRNVAMEEARSRGNAIISQHKQAMDQIFEEHKEEAIRQSKLRIKAETTAGRRTLNLAASKRQVTLRRERSKVQNSLKEQLFAEVKEMLAEYMETEEYMEYLTSHIVKASRFAGGLPMTIYINPSDIGKKDALEDYTGMAITVSREDFMGGIRAVIHSKHILMDYSFQTAIDKEYEEFTFRGGAGIE